MACIFIKYFSQYVDRAARQSSTDTNLWMLCMLELSQDERILIVSD